MRDLHDITFLQAAALGSFSRAAEAMFITAPAVIKRINLLEESLGVKLFGRTHRGLRLTEAGKSMYGDDKRILFFAFPPPSGAGIPGFSFSHFHPLRGRESQDPLFRISAPFGGGNTNKN